MPDSSLLDESLPFAALQLGLDKRLSKATAKMGFVYATMVQAQFIPLALSGKDILARLVQALLPTNRCFIDRQVEQLHRLEPLPPHPVRRTFCEVNVNVTGGGHFRCVLARFV